jgi:hypothetical protein
MFKKSFSLRNPEILFTHQAAIFLSREAVSPEKGIMVSSKKLFLTRYGLLVQLAQREVVMKILTLLLNFIRKLYCRIQPM